MPWVLNASQEVNDKSEYPKILGVCLALTTIMVIIVISRLWVRGFVLKTLGLDDLTIFLAADCSIIYNALCISQSRWGLGLPLYLRPQDDLHRYTLLNYPARPFYMIGVAGFKVALCLAYLRILNRDNRIYRPVVWTVMITCILSHVGGMFVLIFQCRPVRKNWDPLTPGSCLANDTTFYVLAAITIFFDCVIFTLPIPLLLRVQINTRRKLALIGVFLLGLFTTVCSVMRMAQIVQITRDGNSTGLVLWGTIEMNVGICLTCIPALTPLIRYYQDKRLASSQRPNSATGPLGGRSAGVSRSRIYLQDQNANSIKGKGRSPADRPDSRLYFENGAKLTTITTSGSGSGAHQKAHQSQRDSHHEQGSFPQLFGSMEQQQQEPYQLQRFDDRTHRPEDYPYHHQHQHVDQDDIKRAQLEYPAQQVFTRTPIPSRETTPDPSPPSPTPSRPATPLLPLHPTAALLSQADHTTRVSPVEARHNLRNERHALGSFREPELLQRELDLGRLRVRMEHRVRRPTAVGEDAPLHERPGDMGMGVLGGILRTTELDVDYTPTRASRDEEEREHSYGHRYGHAGERSILGYPQGADSGW